MRFEKFLRLFGTPIADDTMISFECQRCGECCQYRDGDSIRLTGYDLFKLARFMGVETPFVLIEQRKVLH